MERIKNFAKTLTGPVNFLKWKYAAEANWVLSTGLPFPDDGWEIIRDEIAARTGEQVVEERKWPVIFSNEEAALIAKKLGADEKAADIVTAIISKTEAIVKR